jgi:predicted alpha/beta-fold hydrolase
MGSVTKTMTYAILTIDDLVGFIPFLSFVGLLLYGIGCCVCHALSLLNQNRNSRQEKDAPSTGTFIDSLFVKSVLFLVLVTHLLSPLSTQIHLKGKRWNPQITRNTSASTYTDGFFDLIHGTDPKIVELMRQMPSLLHGPKPPLIFANRHLQFIPWLIQNELHRLEGIPYQRIHLQVTACLDKSQGTHNCIRDSLMDDTITLDVFPPLNTTSSKFHSGSPMIFFSPGLRCNSQDLPGNMIVRRAFGAGFRSIVVNRRGHTPDQPLQAPRWNLFGDVDDLEQVYWHIHDTFAAPHTPYFLHGISSGTAVVVSALAEWDRRLLLGEKAPSFVGSVSLAPGYDISRVLLPTRFKLPYNTLLTESVKDHFIRQNEQVLRAFDNDTVNEALAATHLQELLNAAAPFAGYPNATAYYAGENPVNNVQHITTPKLILNSIDDPCCNVLNIYERSPYPQHDGKTYAQMVAESPRGLLAVTTSGTHCPFLDTAAQGNLFLPSLLPSIVPDPFNGGWMLDSWADRISIEFYQAALSVYGQERR